MLLAGFLLVLLFEAEDGGGIFLQNIRLFLNYTASQPRRPYCHSRPYENLKFSA
jgi:hypothetical protein